MEFASFSDAPTQRSGAVAFARGAVKRFATTGYGACDAQPATDPVYRAPVGAFATVVKCVRSGDGMPLGAIATSWSLSYNYD